MKSNSYFFFFFFPSQMLKCPRWFTCQKSEYLSGWNQTDKDYCWLVALDFAFLWGKSIKWPAFKFIDFFFFFPCLLLSYLEQEMYDLKEVSMAELMGESLPISCSGSLILQLNTGSLESCMEGCCSAQGTVGCGNPSPTACVLCNSNSDDTVPQGRLASSFLTPSLSP